MQSDLGLRCPHRLEDTFSGGEVKMMEEQVLVHVCFGTFSGGEVKMMKEQVLVCFKALFFRWGGPNDGRASIGNL